MTDDIKTALQEVFVAMDKAAGEVRRCCGSFGQGHRIHDAARAVAPEWLCKWDDDKRWAICLARGYDNLVIIADAFRLSEEAMLASMEPYYNARDES